MRERVQFIKGRGHRMSMVRHKLDSATPVLAQRRDGILGTHNGAGRDYGISLPIHCLYGT
jgi:hypothetical protein